MCKSNFICGSCNGDHHTLLHREKIPAKTVIVNGDEDDEAVLSTAVVEVKDGNGHWKKCRVLLDGGAQVNIISKEFRNKLNIKGCQINKEVEGLERKKSSIEEKVGISLRSKVTQYKTFLNAVVIDKFVSNVPGTRMLLGNFPSNIKLADPKYNIPQGVDLLLSYQFVFDLICDGQIIDKKTNTKLRNTKLGWVAYRLMTANGSNPESSVVTTIQTSCDEFSIVLGNEEVPKYNLTVCGKAM
ncbi:hypothetical protein CVS40_8359 [Lucilia cuprina]|nr:hypothetical protein CVS40_8359 [Lucilia cuprina]